MTPLKVFLPLCAFALSLFHGIAAHGISIHGISALAGPRQAAVRDRTVSSPLVPVLFGDGDPRNGIEDDREPLAKADTLAITKPQAVGLVVCRYVDRSKAQEKTLYHNSTGTLVAMDTDGGYDVVVTAAHVFFRPDTNEEIDICHFHPNGKKKPRIKIHRKNRKYGFDRKGRRKPWNDFAVVRINRRFSKVYGSLPAVQMNEEEYLALAKQGLVLELIAFNRDTKMISVSHKNCRISPKKEGDFYFGVDSVYLHSCDGTHGSSGGALVATVNGQSMLVGIQAALNIDRTTYPFAKYRQTNGVPAGQKFDPTTYAGVAVNFMNNRLWDLLIGLQNGKYRL